ncbi:peptide ABC transporter substrate-binding protein [Streptococcus saliviloxodontae]|uniref:Oligopeptide transport system substrate-binding protein n=1 Tax=Streptococcus saliviloxodontae TaxID=1349416 RepID=A0ABS2PN88_9STRE|nr:peptide ABC transporter substrate-binding protein [Streptococcus saliviloxodontae]MBM7636900.1 oligopeptide transport system substrate-binding protein [Streptococcus saliviloxodontae]
MKRKAKLLTLAGVALASTAVLVACGNSSSSSKNTSTYNYVYTGDPESLDYLATMRATTSNITSNVIDGLMENDQYGNLVGSLAKDWKVSADGLTYTYTLRDDAYWYTADGEQYAQVKAQDFVTGLKHAADKEADALYLVQNSVKGLDAYVKGETKDFSTVGVKAIDDHTVQYTLTRPESFWNSKTTYGILFPVNADFLKSQGDKFGTVDPSTILYNGPYTISSITSKSSIQFAKNENYYDKENVHINAVNWTYYDGSNPGDLYNGFNSGSYTMARLFPNDSSYKDAAKKYKDDIYYAQQDASTYMNYFNLNRTKFDLSKKTDAQKSDAKKALLNKDFRQAINFAFNRKNYSAQANGEEAATYSLRNTLTPPSFVQVDGQDFGKVVDKDLASLGSEWTSINTADAQDGFYNAEKAVAEFNKAKATLSSQGVAFPIQLDYITDQTSETLVNQAKSFKDSVEKALGKENVVINVIQADTDSYNNATYYAESPSAQDWDISGSGWSPDYEDPSTYLDIFSPTSGSLIKNIGITAGSDTAIAEAVGLNEYDQLLQQAAAITQDTKARYEAYAKAQAWLTDSALTMPYYSLGGTPALSKEVPFTSPYANYGTKGDRNYTYKYKELQADPVSKKDYDKAYKSWLSKKEKSNAEYAKKLADHVAK